MTTSNLIEWNKKLDLQWSDFQGRPENDKRQAESAVIMRREEANTEILRNHNGVYFRIKNLQARALFNKSESWVLEKQIHAENQSIILQHERLHFDICELFTRKYNSKLIEVSKNIYECKGTSDKELKEYSFQEGKKILDGIEQEILKECTEFQKKYDLETNYGLNVKEQARYIRLIKKALG